MKKMKKINYAWTYMIIALFAGCAMFGNAPELDTLEKRVAAVEISYGVAVEQAEAHVVARRFDLATVKKLRKVMNDTNVALDATLFALGAGDLSTAEGQYQLVQTGLDIIVIELERLEAKEKENK